jgi:hypothetical protein
LQPNVSRLAVGAPVRVHQPVHGLHLPEKQADKLALFLLTIRMRGVKTYSFFDTF